MTVAILGCGPAGLMAAHAAHIGGFADWQINIFSQKRKSHLNGAQYLHQPIPGTPSESAEPVLVDYRLNGEPDRYRQKVYGPMWDGSVSPEDLDEEHPAWDLRATYDWLWERYSSMVLDVALGPMSVSDVSGFDLVVSTIPGPALCSRGHTFGSTEIWAAGEAPGLGISLPYDCPPNAVICNGEESPSWYRLSNIYGHKTVEWPGSMKQPPVPSVARVQKPTFNNCDCNPDVLRVGRYGAWRKGILTHDAFFRTLEWFL